MKLITWNVNGIRARENEFIALLKEESPDVVMLQETKATIDQLPASLHGLLAVPEYHAIWHGTGGYSGVSIHLKKAAFTRPTSAHPPFDYETRVVEAHTTHEGEAWVFVTMYLPNGGKDFDAKLKFMRALVEYPRSFEGKKLIIAGDLNVARADIDVHKSQRKVGLIGQRDDERELFEKFLASGSAEGTGNLIDVCRALAPTDGTIFTWWPYWRNSRERNVGWRIDYVLANDAIARTVRESRVRREFGTSDHAPVIVTFA